VSWRTCTTSSCEFLRSTNAHACAFVIGAEIPPRLAGRWLRKAEALAGLPPLAGGRWHPYRRLFATELAHVPAKAAAALGGWKDPRTMQAIYQQPEGAALYAAALEVGHTGS
jgi:hypothetical protein